MTGRQVLECKDLVLNLDASRGSLGNQALAGLLSMANRAIRHLQQETNQAGRPLAAVGRLRGTGRGVHFRDLIRGLEQEHPLTLRAPFEDSEKVSGAAWDAKSILGETFSGALAKLRWEAGADDLPMHVHENSDRVIIVHEGRGFFHVSNQRVDRFDGSDVRSIPARERDVFMFTRGVVHTFSTLDEPMTLLSCQLPFIEFDAPGQYRLPKCIWTASKNPEPRPPMVACDPAWTMLTFGP